MSAWVTCYGVTRQRTPDEKATLESFRQKWAWEREELRKIRPDYVLQQDARRLLDLWRREDAYEL